MLDAKTKEKKLIQRGDEQETDLIQFINETTEFLLKLFICFQGLLPGFALVHILMIFMQENDALGLSTYGVYGLRVHQLFHITGTVATYGAIFHVAYYRHICTKKKF